MKEEHVVIDEHKFPAALRHAIGFLRVVWLDQGDKACRIEFDGRAEFTHSGGTTVQGGIITTWIDHAMAWAVHAHDPLLGIASLELKTSFIARVKPGTSVVEARAVKVGRSVAFLEAQLFDTDGSTLAKASSTAAVLRHTGA